MAIFQSTGSQYRKNGGPWWAPLSGGRLPTGWNADGSSKYDTRLSFNFAGIRSLYQSHSFTQVRFYFRQTNEYSAERVYLRITNSSYATLSDGSSAISAVNGWAYITLDSADIAALVSGNAAYAGTYAAANGTYIEIYGTGENAPYFDITAVPREPSPVPPASITAPGKITTGSYTFKWSAGSDTVFPASQLYYELRFSYNGGASYGGAVTSAQGATQLNVSILSYVGLLAGQYFYSDQCYIQVRTKTPPWNGTSYYSSWTTSPKFSVDYRVTPTAPGPPTPSKANPYEGESITFTVARPANYNAYDRTGDVNVFGYRVAMQGGTVLDLESAPATEATKVLSYTVGELTAPKADLTTQIYSYLRDAEGQWSPWSEMVNFTVRRFRAPAVSVGDIERAPTTATILITIMDTGFGGTQSSSQIRKIQYKLGSGAWTDATLGSWSGLKNGFTLTGLDAELAYGLQVRAVNVAPAGTGLADKTGAAFAAIIPAVAPAAMFWSDPNATGNQAKQGASVKALVVGSDFEAPVDAGSVAIQNDLSVGGTLTVDGGIPLLVPWTTLTILGDWTSAGGGTVAPAICMDAHGVVRLRGAIKGGTNGTPAVQIPEELWPPVHHYFVTSAQYNFAAGYILATNGQLVIQNAPAGATFVSLYEISYYRGF